MKLLPYIIIIFSIVSISVPYCYSQEKNVEFKKNNFKEDPDGFRNAMDNLMDGNDYYFLGGIGGYKLALDHYLVANQFNPNNAELNYRIGICYLYSIHKTNAVEFLKKSYSLDSTYSNDIHFRLGQAYQFALEFDEAIKNYNLYINQNQSLVKKELAETIKLKIQECNVGKKLVMNHTPGMIINLQNVNSEYPDYCPLISADEKLMIFTSRRESTTGRERDPDDFMYYEDIYISKNIDNQWSTPEGIGYPINTENHDATVGLSPDGRTLYIYKGERNNGDIYYCELDGDKWTDPKPLPYPINTQARESSATISSDGSTLYFVSDRDLNTGRDIYVCHKNKEGKWGEAEKLPETINTKFDEEGVFIHPDNKTLYFSSKGHETMGGYDIFVSVLDDNKQWSNPVNIGYPINTPDDDVFFTMSASGMHGYFSSVRPDGKGEKDIYLISFSEDITPQGLSSVTLVKGKVVDAITLKPIEAEIEIIDNEKNEQVAVFNTNKLTGEYLVSLPSGKNYGIAVKATDYLFHSENFNIPTESAFQEIVKDIQLSNLAAGSKIVLKNIFFDYASDSIKPESFPELERLVTLLNTYPTMRIEISGHTDNQSSLETNNKLSNDRAKAVADYIIRRGIAKDRIEYKGYAFFFPIASNDTEEGKAQNRRVEFKILSR